MAGRRQILGGLAALTAGLPAFYPARAWWARTLQPDMIVINTTIHTMDRTMPMAQAMAVAGETIIALGSTEEMRGLAGPGTRIIDAGGHTIVPGFIDCHLHALGEMLLYETLVGNPYEVEEMSIAQILDRLRARAAKTPPGQWVEGFFYDDTKVKDRRLITRADLDKVSRVHPVAVYHRGGHTGFVNSKALEMGGITRDTPNPVGGTYDRDANGELNGRLTDTALYPFQDMAPRPQYSSAEKQARTHAALAHMSSQFARYGLTSAHHSEVDVATLQALRAEGKLMHRVNYEVSDAGLEQMIASGLRTGFGDSWIRFGATYEHMADGSFSERTMAISRPYPGRTPRYQGNLTYSQDELDAWVDRVWRSGIQPNIHANGDVAIGMTLTSYEKAKARYPNIKARPKITHCTFVNDDLVRRIREVGAIPAPFTTYLIYNPDKFKFYGQEMLEQCMAFRSFVEAGVPVVAGSDFSPGPFSPIMGIAGMVTRRGWNSELWGPSQRISAADALRIYTVNGAHASYEEGVKGTLTPGKLADFVILSHDPLSVAPETLKDIKIVRTVAGGRTTYEA